MSAQLVPAECPKCHRKESWSVWIGEQGHPMGKCHRAQCGHLGQLDGYAFTVPKKPEPRYYTRPIKPLTAEQRGLVELRFGVNPGEMEGYNAIEDRFILPVYGPDGYNLRGVVAYSLSGGTPKSLNYNEKPEQPFIHVAGDRHNTNIVVVEDWFSAEKVGATSLACGVAIMGTNLSQAAVTEIAELANRTGAKVWLAFDQDAYERSLNYLFKYREQFPGGLFAWRLKQDLKYETTKRITEALVDGRTNFFDRTPNSRSNAEGQEKL